MEGDLQWTAKQELGSARCWHWLQWLDGTLAHKTVTAAIHEEEVGATPALANVRKAISVHAGAAAAEEGR